MNLGPGDEASRRPVAAPQAACKRKGDAGYPGQVVRAAEGTGTVSKRDYASGPCRPDAGQAAQLFAAAQRDNTDILPGLGRGDAAPLFNWLNLHIRSQGCLYMPDELMEKATGLGLDTAAFKAGIQARYLD